MVVRTPADVAAGRRCPRQAHLVSLLAHATDGDRTAFMEFYDLTSGTAFHLALALCGDRSRAEAVTEAAYAQAWADASRYAASGLSPVAWLLSGLMRARHRQAAGRVGDEVWARGA